MKILASSCSVVCLAAFALVPEQEQASTTQETPIHGPFIGHVSSSEANLWMRAARPGQLELRLQQEGASPQERMTVMGEAKVEHDLCLRWRVQGLSSSTRYTYSIFESGTSDSAAASMVAGPYLFTTAALDEADAVVKIAFGSCADEDERTGQVWEQIELHQPDAVVLLGDTPYIDSTELAKQRSRYRAFARHPPLAQVLHHTPWYGTWDDHDFGRNSADGRLDGKQRARRVFLEYHANPYYGEGGEGIYTNFRHGPVEVFLVDPRWFAGTTKTTWAESGDTLLGAKQWEWLERTLRQSTAPIKVIASGMIFNSAVRPLKPDYWGAYPEERQALFALIGRLEVEGVILVSGDIHRSRVVRHATEATAGYDIVELITSPMHHRVIGLANAPHPGLIKDMGAPNTFMLLTVDKAAERVQVTARFIDRLGAILFEYEVEH